MGGEVVNFPVIPRPIPKPAAPVQPTEPLPAAQLTPKGVEAHLLSEHLQDLTTRAEKALGARGAAALIKGELGSSDERETLRAELARWSRRAARLIGRDNRNSMLRVTASYLDGRAFFKR